MIAPEADKRFFVTLREIVDQILKSVIGDRDQRLVLLRLTLVIALVAKDLDS
jgi:hypothetical protein